MQWQQPFRLLKVRKSTPLWSGLMLRAQLARSAATARTSVVAAQNIACRCAGGAPRDVELTLIHRAVLARGNVEAAARALASAVPRSIASCNAKPQTEAADDGGARVHGRDLRRRVVYRMAA